MARGDTQRIHSSPYSIKDLEKWRQILITRRRGMVRDVAALHDESIPEDHVSVSSNHIAEGATDTQSQDLSLSAAHDEQQLLQLIDRAITKIDSGKPLPFGICEYTCQPIANDRLQLLPWTPFSTEGAEHVESHGLTLDDLSD